MAPMAEPCSQGRLSKSATASEKRQMATAFAAADADHDGRISLEVRIRRCKVGETDRGGVVFWVSGVGGGKHVFLFLIGGVP